MKRVAIAVLLAWPLGALAAGTAIGPESDSPKISAAGAPMVMQPLERRANSNLYAWRDDSDRLTEPVWRYGGREPQPEELPVTGRTPAIGENVGGR